MEEPKVLPLEPDYSKLVEQVENNSEVPTTIAYENDEAQIDPRGQSPVPQVKEPNQMTRTSLLFVLFEYALEHHIIELKFIEQCSTIWRLDKFANASFHSSFQKSVAKWRKLLAENETQLKRLLKQHSQELERLTYPLPKRSGAKTQRKRGYRDKGSTRPFHKRGRTDAETTLSIHYLELQVVEKVRIFGRRPTVTYRRLPYSGRIRQALEDGLLERVGDFYIPTSLEKD